MEKTIYMVCASPVGWERGDAMNHAMVLSCDWTLDAAVEILRRDSGACDLRIIACEPGSKGQSACQRIVRAEEIADI